MYVAQFVQRYPPALGGSETYTARLCAYLASCGDHVTVWTSNAIELTEMWQNCRSASAPILSPNGISVRRFAPLTFPARRYILKALSLVPHYWWQCLTAPCSPICPDMWRAARQYDAPIDAVHATAFPYAFPIVCGLKLARRRGVPFLLTPFLHLGDPTNAQDRTRSQYTAPHLRWLLKQADCVFVQTHTEHATVVSFGVPEDRVVLQGLGVDPNECTGGNRTAARASWHVEAETVVVGHLANNSIEKGTVDLLRAAEYAWAAGHNFRVVLAGPEMPSFHSFWRTFTRKDHVTRLGVLTEAQKRDFFAGIDCFALPSRVDSFGLVLLEAWANSKPLLVYRAGGPAELVRDELDGLQSACGDVNQLAAQLVRLVTDWPLRTRLGQAGHARIGHEFRWPDKLHRVRTAIHSAMESLRRRRFSPTAIANCQSPTRIPR